MKIILLVFGTRPEAIKMCPLVKKFQQNSEIFKTVVCVTGQHCERLDQVLKVFDVKPDFDLNIMKQGQDLYDVTARVFLGMRDVLNEVHPDVVLVHGDTTTSTAAALAAFYQQIPVGHVEAGLRTHNIYSPWPEELNRQITGRIAAYNFSPTPLSENLEHLGNMFFIEPLEYLTFVRLMDKSAIVLTDSGGIQEEAPGLGKPVLVMRDTTERPEALSSGTVHLVGTDYGKIIRGVSTLLEDHQAYEKMSRAVNPYGDGKACERIVEYLK